MSTLNLTRPSCARRVASNKVDGKSWFRIDNATADEATVHIYDEIGGWGIYADEFAAQMREVTAPRLALRINSPGGDVFDGIAIMNTIRNHPANVTVHVDGLAASAASFIAMAGDRVIMERNSTMMIHDALGLCVGNQADMAQMGALLDKVSDNIASVYAERSGIDQGAWRDLMQAETWFSADEAVTAGLADEVASAKQRSEEPVDELAAKSQWMVSAFKYAGRDNAPAPVIPAPKDDVMWVNTGGSCERCQENADAGPIPDGHHFPSGDQAPPAHPHCNCVLEEVLPENVSAPVINADRLRSLIREVVRA